MTQPRHLAVPLQGAAAGNLPWLPSDDTGDVVDGSVIRKPMYAPWRSTEQVRSMRTLLSYTATDHNCVA
jgi:hypothetical protein